MKKRFSRRHNSIIGSYPWMGPAALAAIAVVIMFAGLRFLVPGALVALGTPFWTMGNTLTASVGQGGSFFTSKASLQEKVKRLESENAALLVKSATAEARARDLERLLGDRTEAVGGVVAGVLSRPPVSPYDVIVVDQGSRDGVSEGSRVEGPGGTPIGTIESVMNGSSRVLLYSAPGKETESWIGEARIPVTLVGEGAGAMSAIVARESGITVGDLVYVSGPGARAIGSVIKVGNDPSSPRTRIDIRPLANPFSFTWVTVLP